MEDMGATLDEMRRREEAGCKSALKLALLQGRCAARYKKIEPKTWKTTLQENVGSSRATWFQRVACYREFGEILLHPVDDAEGDESVDVAKEWAGILPSSLGKLVSVVKGCDEKAKEAWLDSIVGLSFSDVCKLVAEAKGKEPHDCGPFKEIEIKAWECLSCGKVKTKEPEGDPACTCD
jgi:hypothetical protein